MAAKFLKIDRAGHFAVGRTISLLSNWDHAVATESNFWIRADKIVCITKGYRVHTDEDGAQLEKFTPSVLLGLEDTERHEIYIPIRAGITVSDKKDLRWTLSEDAMKAQIEALIAGGEQTITCCCSDHEEEEDDDEKPTKDE